MLSRSFESASITFTGLKLLINFLKSEKIFIAFINIAGKNNLFRYKLLGRPAGWKLIRIGLNCLSSFEAAKGIYDSL